MVVIIVRARQSAEVDRATDYAMMRFIANAVDSSNTRDFQSNGKIANNPPDTRFFKALDSTKRHQASTATGPT